jgi:hypothetical protein
MTTTYQPITEAEAAELFSERRITLRTSVAYQGFTVEVQAEGYTLDQLVSMLTRRGCTPAQQAQQGQPAAPSAASSEEPPLCPDHNRPMKQGRYGWFCSAKSGDTYCSRKA